MRTTLLSLVIAAAAVAVIARMSLADKAFRDQFVAKYVKADSADPKEAAFAASVNKANCQVCHVGQNKKNRNPYGQALAQLLSRKTDKEDKEKILSSLDKVAAMKTEPANPSSPTFGDLIKQGKLPGSQAKHNAAP